MCRRMTREPSNYEGAPVEAPTRSTTPSFADLLHKIDTMSGQFDISAYGESTLPFDSEFDGFENVGTRPTVTETLVQRSKASPRNSEGSVKSSYEGFANAANRPVFTTVRDDPDATARQG